MHNKLIKAISNKNSDLSTIKTLLQNPEIDINAEGKWGIDGYNGCNTPLTKAIHCENLEVMQLLLEHPKIDVNSNIYLMTPLMIAIANCQNFQIVELLLQHPKIDVNQGGDYGSSITPLSEAIKRSFKMIKLLLAQPNIKVDISELNDILRVIYYSEQTIEEKLTDLKDVIYFLMSRQPINREKITETFTDIINKNNYICSTDQVFIENFNKLAQMAINDLVPQNPVKFMDLLRTGQIPSNLHPKILITKSSKVSVKK